MQMSNIIAILSSACASAGLDPLAWASISAADLIAARAGRESATPASVSADAQIAYERGLRLAAETRVAVLEELLAMQGGAAQEFAGDDDDDDGEFVDEDEDEDESEAIEHLEIDEAAPEDRYAADLAIISGAT